MQLRQAALEQENQELRESRAQLQSALTHFAGFYDFAPVGFVTLDATGVILEANLTVASLLGVERDMLVGRRFSSYLMAEDQEIFLHFCEQHFESGAAQSCELLLMPNGRPPFWARLEAPPARTGELDRFAPYQIMLSDITERKQMEETLRRSERQLSDVIDFLPDATLAVDSEKRIIVWNKAIERMTGLKAEEMIGKGDYEYAIPFYGERRPILMDRAWDREQNIAESYSQLDREGESLSAETFCGALYGGRGAYVFAKVSPLHDQNGQVIGAIESIRDISELKQSEDMLGKAYAELESQVEERTMQLLESNRDLEHFAHIASHDLREPLLLIQAFGRRLANKYGALLDASGQGYLQRIEILTERLTRLLNSMLLYSQVATRPNPTAPVDLTQIAGEVVGDLQMRLEQSGGRVELADLGCIEADHLQMHQLLQNLLANALKYHHPGRPPVVKITSRLRVDEAGASWRDITVEDNGIGFAESQGSRLFEMFHRHHPEALQEGSGIGLAICKRIVERHGGTITASGRPGEGAKFIVSLPSK
jgi:PAS domain S-box-containing protein